MNSAYFVLNIIELLLLSPLKSGLVFGQNRFDSENGVGYKNQYIRKDMIVNQVKLFSIL